jgi:hypothetical protein
MKFGTYTTVVTAGDLLKESTLGSLVTLQPTFLWDLPTFRSRLGVHFIADLNSAFGLMPISGIGFSGYFYLLGMSTAYEISDDGTLKQTSKPGPYVYGGLTPVNFNINSNDEENPSRSFAFSSLIVETALGVGFDYPLRRNTLITGELAYRFGTAPDPKSDIGDLEYSGIGLNISFSTSYY